MGSNLTLSVDAEVVRKAKRFARRQGTSVSRLVERYLELVSSAPKRGAASPVLRRLRGSLKRVRAEGHRRHLRDRYR